MNMQNIKIKNINLPKFIDGWVWLVGAGPGDAGLLTIHALNALDQADVIVYDALVSQDVLNLANKDAKLVFAGKRGGKPSPKQQSISKKIIKFARQGHRVLRLKGGDPFVFGRGGEEALALVGAGINFRVIPGITAGVGGLAYAGIPATHRDANSAITFITGHSVSGNIPENLNWHSLATGAPVLVFYMAIKHMPSITKRLITAGRKDNEPVAFIENACTNKQRVVTTDLANAGIISKDISPPAIVVIGPVVDLRHALDWMGAIENNKSLNFDNLPDHLLPKD